MQPLSVVENHFHELAGQVQFYGQTVASIMMVPLWQAVLNMMGKAQGDPKILQGGLIDDALEQAKGGKNTLFVLWMRFFNMKLAFLFYDYALAEKYVDAAPKIYNSLSGALDASYTLFYECMTLLALARQGRRRYRRIIYVRCRLKRLKSWAWGCPVNFLGKQFLIEAELAAVCGKRQKASSHYRSGILHSREGGFLLDEALGNEQLGAFYLESEKDEQAAVPFILEAKRLYEKWGGVAKVQCFQEKYGGVLSRAHGSVGHTSAMLSSQRSSSSLPK